MRESNLVKARLIGVTEVQRLNLRLMELASFNGFNGYDVVKDLLEAVVISMWVRKI